MISSTTVEQQQQAARRFINSTAFACLTLVGAEPYAKRDGAAAKAFNERIREIVQSEAGAEKERFWIHPVCILSVKETTEPLTPGDGRNRMPKCGKTIIEEF